MSKIIEALKEKFTEYRIPLDTANPFLEKYSMFESGLLPEIELCELPSDDCFKTLQTYCDSVEETSDELLIHKLLQIPFSQIQAVKDKLLDFIDTSAIEKGYQKTEMYFVDLEFIDELKFFLESKNIQQTDYSKWFVEALFLGKHALGLVNGIFELFDDEYTAKKIVSEAAIWYPYSDPIGLIAYLAEQGLANDQICKLLLEDPILIMYYREEGSRVSRYGHNQVYIDDAIKKALKE